MPSSSLLPEEQAELGRLLGIVVEQDKGFIPDSAYRLIHKLVPWPVVEVLIYDDVGRFLLTYRDDEFTGWHIPGTFIKPGESYKDACRRCVCDEKVADSVTNLKLIASHPQLQGEHPFGYPISNIIACQAIGEVKERQDLKWFSDIPIDLIPLPQQHYMFLAYFQQWFREKGGSATIL